jgi:hypothetical protein
MDSATQITEIFSNKIAGLLITNESIFQHDNNGCTDPSCDQHLSAMKDKLIKLRLQTAIDGLACIGMVCGHIALMKAVENMMTDISALVDGRKVPSWVKQPDDDLRRLEDALKATQTNPVPDTPTTEPITEGNSE